MSDPVEMMRTAALEQAKEILERCFDSVQIIVTTHEKNSTIVQGIGSGNYYARYGSVSEWLRIEEHEMQNRVMHDSEEDF